MKTKLDAVWNDNRIACPNHLVKWNTEKIGNSVFMNYGLWFRKGTNRKPKGMKIKGKGWTWLCKNYGLYHRVAERKK